MNVTILGCGRWGTFIGSYTNSLNHKTKIWGRKDSKRLKRLVKDRKNEYLTLDNSIDLTSNLKEAIEFGKIIVISINSQQLRNLTREIKKYNYANKIFVLCMKGIENTTGTRLSTVVYEELGKNTKVAIWVGPGHVEDFVKNIPNCMVIDSLCKETQRTIIEEFNSDLIRFYYGNDMIGNEIGAASKNVIGIAAGMLDGLGYTSLKGALMARGAREISRLIKEIGGNEITAYGLSHLGDYQATLFSDFSHNRCFGESFAKKAKYDKLAEGVFTVKALLLLGEKYNVDLPISRAVYDVVYNKMDIKTTLLQLYDRPLKDEFKK